MKRINADHHTAGLSFCQPMPIVKGARRWRRKRRFVLVIGSFIPVTRSTNPLVGTIAPIDDFHKHFRDLVGTAQFLWVAAWRHGAVATQTPVGRCERGDFVGVAPNDAHHRAPERHPWRSERLRSRRRGALGMRGKALGYRPSVSAAPFPLRRPEGVTASRRPFAVFWSNLIRSWTNGPSRENSAAWKSGSSKPSKL